MKNKPIILLTGWLLTIPMIFGQQEPVHLGLPRLQSNNREVQVGLPRLASDKFQAIDLTQVSAPGVRSGERRGAAYLAIDPHREWSRPLRGNSNEASFVSILVYGSAGTTIDLGGARFAVAISPVDGHVQLMAEESSDSSVDWRPLGIHVSQRSYEGAQLGSFPVLTVRIDPVAGVWDVYAAQRLLAADLPFASAPGRGTFKLRAGESGAWLCGLVMADENPLFVDANRNGIDDAFELERGGRLLQPVDGPVANERQTVQRTIIPEAMLLKRPTPDGR